MNRNHIRKTDAKIFLKFLLLPLSLLFIFTLPIALVIAAQAITVSDVGTNQTKPASRVVGPGFANQSVDAFSLKTDADIDTVTAISIDASGSTNTADISSVKIYQDTGSISGYYDTLDTLVGQGSFSGTTAIIAVSIPVTTTETSYIITYDTSLTAGNGDILIGKVGSITSVTNQVTNNDTADATLTVDSAPPATVADFNATDGDNAQSVLSWTNPTDTALAEVTVLRKTDSYPANHTDGTVVYDNTAPESGASISTTDTALSNGTTYYYAVFTKDAYGNWNDMVDPPPAPQNADTAQPYLSITISDAGAGQTKPASRIVAPNYLDQSVDAFSLKTAQAADNITQIVVDGAGSTNLSDVSAVKIYQDANNNGLYDIGETLAGSGTFSGTSATIPVSISVTTTEVSYIVAYDISANPVNADTLVGKVSSLGGTPNQVTNNDTADATLTVDSAPPATVADFNATDGDNAQSVLSWTNPTDTALAEVTVLRKTDSYPANHTDGTVVYDNTAPESGASISTTDTALSNGTTYYYAVFTKDAYGNWNDMVDPPPAPQNADTAQPLEQQIQFSNCIPLGGTVAYQGQTNKVMMRFTVRASSGSSTWDSFTLDEYGSGLAFNNIQSVKLYRDNGDGNFDPRTDIRITLDLPATFGPSSDSSTFIITGGETITTTPTDYFIAYDIKDSAMVGATVGAMLTAANSPIPVTGIDSTFISNTPVISGDIVNVVPTDYAPRYATAGQTDVCMLGVALATNYGTAQVAGIRVLGYGTEAAGDFVTKVYLYKDDGNGSFNKASDQLLASGTFASDNTVDLTFSQQVVDTKALKYFIVYDLSPTAPNNPTVGAELTDASFISVAPPDTVNLNGPIQSGLIQIPPSVMVSAQPVSRGSVTVGQNYVVMQSLNIKTDLGVANWTGFRLEDYGSGSAPANVSSIYLAKETNGKSGYQGSNTPVGPADTIITLSQQNYSANPQLFMLASPETIASSGSTYYIIYSISDTATVGSTVGTRIADESAILVESPAKVKPFSALQSNLLSIVQNVHEFSGSTNLCGTCHFVHLAPDFSSETTIPANSQYSTNVILNKAYLDNPDVVNNYSHDTYNLLCEACHDGTGASTNIKADYDSDSPYAGHQTSSEGTQTIGWKPPPSGKKYNAHMKIPCMVCHDSHGSSKGNYKMLADGLYAYATSPTGGNWADPNENGKIDPGAEACLVCHPKSTETNRNSIIAGIKMPYLPVGGSVNHDTVTGCDCHNTHNPQPPNATESVGGTACESCHANILNSMQSSSGYHHYVITAEAVYPTESPAGNNYMLQPGTRSCLMCHVDHDMFRPDLNSNGNRARNLRAEIQTAPSKNDINSYMATDFDNNAMRGGICLSCHAAASFTKDTNGQTGGSTTTQLLNKNDYNASAHNYQASSTFTKDTSAFKGNCVKCHNDTTNKLYQSTTPKFANHNSNFKSLLTDNGTAGGGTGIPTAEAADIDNSGLEENFCYLCHSGTGAGGNDIYGQLMSGKAKNIKDQFAKAYRHPVETPGKHTSDEFEKAAPGWMPANNRHAECEDCHNPHAAKAGDRAVGDPANGNKAGPAIAGIWGVSVTDWATGAFAKTPSVTFEYELCLKCHSSYAWGTGPAPATTWPNGAAGATQADPVQDFNPGNLGYHPVAATGKTAPTGGGATKLPLTFIAPYAWNSLITCSDCHGDDGWISNGSVASGPHGSNSRYMLRRYYNSAQGVWTSNFCYECHDYKVYGFQQLGPNIDIYSAPMDPYKSYSRVDHPLTSKMANGSLNMFRLNQDESSGPMCFNCHGAYGGTIQNMRLGGIHGSNQGVGTYGTSPIGQRLMNGSNVIGYTAPSTTLSGSCWTSGTASNPSLSDCTQHSSGVSISNSNWDY